MDLNFSIDFDSGEVWVLLDHSNTCSVVKNDDGTFSFRNFNKIEDEDFKDKLKKIVKIIFELENL